MSFIIKHTQRFIIQLNIAHVLFYYFYDFKRKVSIIFQKIISTKFVLNELLKDKDKKARYKILDFFWWFIYSYEISSLFEILTLPLKCEGPMSDH